jgi:hypothetical protein
MPHTPTHGAGAGSGAQGPGPQYPPDLLSALESMGMSDYAYMFGGDASQIAEQLGLTDEQAQQFSQYLPQFASGQFGELLGGIPGWKQEQLGLLQEQYGIGQQAAISGYKTGMEGAQERLRLGTAGAESAYGLGKERVGQRFEGSLENLRAKALQDLTQARQLGHTFAGSGAAQFGEEVSRDVLGTAYGGMQSERQSSLEGLEEQKGMTLDQLASSFGLTSQQLSEAKQESLSKLGLSHTAGVQQVGEQADVKLGQAYGLLSDYINKVLGLGAQFAGYDPTGGTGTTGSTTGGGKSGGPDTSGGYQSPFLV